MIPSLNLPLRLPGVAIDVWDSLLLTTPLHVKASVIMFLSQHIEHVHLAFLCGNKLVPRRVCLQTRRRYSIPTNSTHRVRFTEKIVVQKTVWVILQPKDVIIWIGVQCQYEASLFCLTTRAQDKKEWLQNFLQYKLYTYTDFDLLKYWLTITVSYYVELKETLFIICFFLIDLFVSKPPLCNCTS